MSDGFFKMLRGEPAEPPAAPPSAEPAERIPRRSTGLTEFSRCLHGEEHLRILDLGPTSPSNIAFITGQGHKVYNEDILLAATDPRYQAPSDNGKAAVDVDRFLAENLLYTTTLLDAALCWDIPDYLPEDLVKPAVGRIHRALKRGGVLLAFFHTRDAGPDAPYYRYHIASPDSLELQRGPHFRLQRVYQNRHIENLFREFSSVKFFLARDNVREVLVIK
ncbi:MAG: SAM-dependent methyltransferase [Terriglobales bacterium]